MTIEIYTRPSCGYCYRAKRLLDQKGLAYKEYDIEDTTKKEEMIERSQRTTVPQVFIEGIHIGGFDDLDAYAKAGKLPAESE